MFACFTVFVVKAIFYSPFCFWNYLKNLRKNKNKIFNYHHVEGDKIKHHLWICCMRDNFPTIKWINCSKEHLLWKCCMKNDRNNVVMKRWTFLNNEKVKYRSLSVWLFTPWIITYHFSRQKFDAFFSSIIYEVKVSYSSIYTLDNEYMLY